MGNKPDGYSLGKDAWGDEYFQQGDKIVNENNQETYESKRNRAIASYNAAQQAQQQAAANEAARKANRQAESEMIRDAIKKAGGLPFGIGGTYGNSRTRMMSDLFRPLSNWESFIIKAFVVFMLGYVAVFTLYYAVIEPVTKSVKGTIRSVKGFFQGVFQGIKHAFLWIWDKIVWFFSAWIDNVKALFVKLNYGFFGRLFFRLFILCEILFAVLLIFDLCKRLKERTRPLYFTALDAYYPPIILFVIEFLTWLIFRPWNFLGMLYNTFCLSAWLIIAEYVIIKYFRKKNGIL